MGSLVWFSDSNFGKYPESIGGVLSVYEPLRREHAGQ